MRIPNEIVKIARENPTDGVIEICKFVLRVIETEEGWTAAHHDVLVEGSAIILGLEEQGLIGHRVNAPDLDGDMGYVCNQMRKFLMEVQADFVGQSTARRLESLKANFTLTLSNGFGYEFTDGDLSRIQALINELRELLAADSGLEADHKRRLLKRLEELQKELHKKISDLSNFYNLMGDFGVALGRLGNDAKPITDRLKEIVGFAWKAQARAEQLPSSADNPMLSNESNTPALE